MRNRYLRNRLFRWGLVLLVVGSGPLWGIILAAQLGIWPDPNPNPIGPGLLFFFTIWPALALLVLGIIQVRREEPGEPPPP